MLAPGEYLTTPPPAEPNRELVVRRGDATNKHEPSIAAPVQAPEEPETRSFLLTLLHSLGAVHS